MESHSLLLLAINKKIFLPIFSTLIVIASPVGRCTASQIADVNQSPGERELFNTLPGESQKGGILDATNPMELMNRLKRATAMDDATPPSDAIDDALKGFEIEALNKKER